jgi:hypothetical protein
VTSKINQILGFEPFQTPTEGNVDRKLEAEISNFATHTLSTTGISVACLKKQLFGPVVIRLISK